MSFRMAEPEGVAVVKVFGVGGGGGNAINTMVSNGVQGVEFIAANTDKQALMQSKADIPLQLGINITKGLGAGADPDIGALAAEESAEEIKKTLEGADMVFVTTGLGGGTGTGAAPVVARISKELGALTVAVVTKPFTIEGKFREKNADQGWAELRKYADTIITIPNDRLLTLAQKTSKFIEMMAMADNVLLEAVKGITDLINVPGFMNADFADLRTVMREVGPAIMGTGSAVGENRAQEAAKRAIDNPLLEDSGIDGARGLLINISASQESFSMPEFTEAVSLIQERVDEDAKVVVGALFDDSLDEEMKVTVIATGVGDMVSGEDTIEQIDNLYPASLGNSGQRLGEKKRDSKRMDMAKAPRNTVSKGPKLPGSNFETIEHLNGMYGDGEQRYDVSSWSEDNLETPTYLRKKAN